MLSVIKIGEGKEAAASKLRIDYMSGAEMRYIDGVSRVTFVFVFVVFSRTWELYRVLVSFENAGDLALLLFPCSSWL